MTTYTNFTTEVYLDGEPQGYYATPDWYTQFDSDGDAHFFSDKPEDWDDVHLFEPGIPEDFIYLDHDFDDAYRILALMMALGEWDLADSATVNDRTCTVDVGRRTYIVATDSEADDLWEAQLVSYLDDVILCELDGVAANYFDRDRWIEDAKHDGRAECLASYDGSEQWADTNEGTYYVYRQT